MLEFEVEGDCGPILGGARRDGLQHKPFGAAFDVDVVDLITRLDPAIDAVSRNTDGPELPQLPELRIVVRIESNDGRGRTDPSDKPPEGLRVFSLPQPQLPLLALAVRQFHRGQFQRTDAIGEPDARVQFAACVLYQLDLPA